MTRFLLPVLGLSAIYSMILQSIHPWDMAAGVIITVGTLMLFRRHLRVGTWAPLTGLGRKAGALLRLPGYVFIDTVQGVWTVSVIVLGLRSLDCSGIVAIPIWERTPTGVAVTAWATTLSPGSVLIDVDWERGVMLFHFIDATEPEKLRQKIQTFYERYQQPIFP
jgi:multisubunit Na+/H+ antiporter MnhE subunit